MVYSSRLSDTLRAAVRTMFGVVHLTNPPGTDHQETPQERYWFLLADLALRPRHSHWSSTRCQQLRRLAKQSALAFFRSEIGLGLTFAHIASCARPGAAKRTRNESKARLAYDTAVHFSRNVSWEPKNFYKFSSELGRLKDALEDLGQVA